MSASSKSNTPTPVTTTQSKDWMKAVTLELNAGTDDKTEVVVAKQGKQKQCKQARLAEQERQRWEQEERQRKEREEAEHKAKEETERKVVGEQQVWEEAVKARWWLRGHGQSLRQSRPGLRQRRRGWPKKRPQRRGL